MFSRLLTRCSRVQLPVAPSTRISQLRNIPRRQRRLFATSSHMMAAFERLIRFQTSEGKTVYGNLEKETPTREIEGSNVEILEGDVKQGFKRTGGKATVSKLLCPLPTTNIILCVGLNYKQHAEECNVSLLACWTRLRNLPSVLQFTICPITNGHSLTYQSTPQSS